MDREQYEVRAAIEIVERLHEFHTSIQDQDYRWKYNLVTEEWEIYRISQIYNVRKSTSLLVEIRRKSCLIRNNRKYWSYIRRKQRHFHYLIRIL